MLNFFCRTSISSLESRLTNGSPGSSFSKTYASVSEISSPHIIQPTNMNQFSIQNYQVQQQQPLIKPPILPPKAAMGVANPTNTSRAVASENGQRNLFHRQPQPPYVAPPFYENIEDVATSSMISVFYIYILDIALLLSCKYHWLLYTTHLNEDIESRFP